MMHALVRSSMKYQFLVITIAIAMMAFGITQFRGMPVDVLPEFLPPYVEIQTEALGLSAEEVEQMITVPVEQDLLAGVAWLDVIRSESVPGLSSVLVYFEPGTDIYRARQMVTERLSTAAIAIPHVSKPPTMIQPLSSQSRFMIVGLSSEELSLIEMSVLARWTIAPQLMGVPGVAHVAIWGNRDRQLQVQVDPVHLQETGVTLAQVVSTTGNALWVSPLSFLEASSPGTGGFIDTPNQRLNVWHVLPISSAEELAKVPVEGTSLLLGDVAQVVEDHPLLIGDALISEEPSLLLVIEKLPGINTLEVTRGIEAELAALQPGMPGMNFDATLFHPATYIEMALANLGRTLIIAALLVVLVLGVFLYGWRTALISLVAIVTSLMAALFVLYVRGETLNAMVLAGLVIALGLVIDDAIVDVERIVQRLRLNRQQGGLRSVPAVILEAAGETRSALFLATLITLLAVLPVFFIEGISGGLYRPLAITYSLAVLAAMVVALTVTPALSVILLSRSRLDMKESPFVARLQGSYERNLAKATGSPALANIAIVVLVVAALVALPFLKRDSSLPKFQEPYLTVRFQGAPGTSQTEMNRILTRVSGELRAIPGVSNVGAHVGRAVFGDQTVNVNSSEVWVSIAPNANYEATVAAVEEAVNSYPGLDREVRTFVQQSLSRVQTDDSHDITVRLYGEDHDVLRVEVEKLRQAISTVSGVVDPRVDLPVDEPTLEIEVDLNSAQRYGVKPGDVRRSAAILLSGMHAGSLFEEQKIFDVVVWGTPETRHSLSDIQNLLIDTPGGGHVRLGEVADVRVVSSPTVIRREAVSPYLDIDFNVEGRSAAAVAQDVDAVIKNFGFPLEYHAEVVSDFATRQAAQQGILIASAVAILGIFLLLQAAFRNWRLALISIVTLPAALAGGLLADLLGNGGALSLGLLAGCLTTLGIAFRNSVMLFSHYEYLEEHDGMSFGTELVARGARERLSPTLMTALATILALLPFALFGNIPGHEIVRPIAIVTIGGLVTTTWLNLFALPSLYLRFGASREADLGFQPVAGADLPAVATD
ncbi:MAG TPA: efflux RND transporter permease subunit [Anaerolineales bacterium]|nr:efflux RND transporter permease subunit [Anaerolineales bacterium]